MVRKIDTSQFDMSSWNELWIGFRWRISSSYDYVTHSVAGTPIDPFGSYSDFEFGLCRTDGLVYGQSGSSIDLSNQHTFGMRKSDTGASGTTYWEMRTSGSTPYTMVTGGGYMIQRATGSSVTAGLLSHGRWMTTFINTSYFTASYRSAFVLRIMTSSLNPNRLDVSYCFPNYTNAVAMQTDFSSSAMLADFMVAPTWADLTVSASLRGYNVVNPVMPMTISQSLFGYFDGIFFTWRRLYDNLEISDVVVRRI
jgi:hypothetical protein